MWFGITSTCSLEKVRLSRKREGDSRDAAAVRPSSGERDLVCGGGRREQRHGVPGAGSQNEASWDATAAKSSRTAPSPSPLLPLSVPLRLSWTSVRSFDCSSLDLPVFSLRVGAPGRRRSRVSANAVR